MPIALGIAIAVPKVAVVDAGGAPPVAEAHYYLDGFYLAGFYLEGFYL